MHTHVARRRARMGLSGMEGNAAWYGSVRMPRRSLIDIVR